MSLPALTYQPTNHEAEMALLASVFADPRQLHAAAEIVAPEHFADDRHLRLWQACLKLDERGVRPSPITLKSYFERDRGLQEIGGTEYLARLAAAPVITISAPQYARVIRDTWQRRQLIIACQEVTERAQSPDVEDTADSLIEGLEASLYNLTEATAR
jgi:replicative DNA helicase